MMKLYVCICGKSFSNSQAYNGHKAHCKEGKSEEQILKVLDYEHRTVEKMHKGYSECCRKLREKSLAIWVSEKHKCEFCGNLLETKYATGRFCDVHCARAYSSKMAKENPNSFKAFAYGRYGSVKSPYEQILEEKLLNLGIDYIWNATWRDYGGTTKHRYILDFYLPKYKVDLEYDGKLHEFHKVHDRERDAFLHNLGIYTYRLKGYDTDETLEEQFFEFVSWLHRLFGDDVV